MGKVYVATKDDLNQTRIDLAARFAVAEQSGSGATQVYTGDADGTPVGRVVFDCVLRDGYVKANGATVASASQDYPRLVEFVLSHQELLAANEEAYVANTALYMYNTISDVMTLPNYIGKVIQGGDNVISIKAGLPNITGNLWGSYCSTGTKENLKKAGGTYNDSTSVATYSFGVFSATASGTYAYNKGISMTSDSKVITFDGPSFNASRSSAIYGASSTVQPPAITLIPQIRY